MTNEQAINELDRCKSLIQQNGEDWLDERDIPVLDMAINALKTQQWIPVSERLPNYNAAVLVTEENGRVCVAYLDDVLMGEWYDGDLNAIEPIAWMKIPEPYKGEQNEEI